MDDRMELTYEKTPEEERAELTKKAQPLIEFGLPAHLFDRTLAIMEGYRYKNIYKMVKTMAHYHNNGHLKGVIALSCQKGFYNTHTTMNHDQFANLVKFLNSKEGQVAVQGVQKITKLVKKAGNMFTPKEVALLDLFRIQREDYERALKEEMSAFDKEIENRREQIRELERRWKEREKEIKEEFEKNEIEHAELKDFRIKRKEGGEVG